MSSNFGLVPNICEDTFVNLIQPSKVFADPIHDSIRDDPRFEQIVEKKLGRQIDPH